MPIKLLVFLYADKLYVTEITESGEAEAVSLGGKQALPLLSAAATAEQGKANLPQVVTESAQNFLQAICENYSLTSLQDEVLDMILIDCGADKRQIANILYALAEVKSCCLLSIEHVLPQVVWQRIHPEAGTEIVVDFAGKYYRLSCDAARVLRYKARGRKDKVDLELTAEDFACLYEYRPEKIWREEDSEHFLRLKKELLEARSERDRVQAELNVLRPDPNSLFAKKIEVIKKYTSKTQCGANFYAKGNIPKGKLEEALKQFKENNLSIDKDKVIGLFDFCPPGYIGQKGCTYLIVFTEEALFKSGSWNGYVKIRYDDISTMDNNGNFYRSYHKDRIVINIIGGGYYCVGIYDEFYQTSSWGMSERDFMSLLNELRALSVCEYGGGRCLGSF